MTELPLASVDRILRNAGAERVSEDAKLTLAEKLEEYGGKIAAEAIKWTKHANRKTIKSEDIEEASRRVG